MATAQQQLYAAIARYAPSVDHLARTRYGISGAALLAKVVQGESGAWADPGSSLSKVSPAGARGTGQFMPGSRRIAIQKYGIDPWRSITDAVHGTALHLRGLINGSSGLEGYNPGDPSYPSYILGQRVGDVGKAIGVRPGGAGGTATSTGGSAAAVSGLTDVPSFQQTLSLRTGPAPIPVTMPPAPSFAATPPLPAGYPGVPQSGGPAPAPDFSLPDPTQAQLPAMPVPNGAVDQPGGTRGVTVHDAGGYPASRRGKIIGVPYQGTHNLGNWQSDRAVDIALPMGTPILSVGDGVVVKVHGAWHGGRDRFDGYQVTIRLANGNSVFYTHLRSKRVKAGQRVRAGQTLGGSGAANGVEHLHFASEKEDPRALIGAR